MVSLPADHPDEMLAQALAKARKLVADLERQQAEIEANPPKLPPDQLEQGRQAFNNALASARRMVRALEDAGRVSPFPEPDPS
jgi:hypothetical protein